MKEQIWLEEGWLYHNHAWHILHEIIKSIGQTGNLLDIGAGPGIAASIISAFYPDIEVNVTDISPECIPLWEKRGLNGLLLYNLKKIPWKDENFDYVICSHVLEHIEERDIHYFLNELWRVCSKRIIIVIPDGDVHFYDHKVIYNRTILKEKIREAYKNKEFIFKSYPYYHPHINNLIAVIDK